MIRAAAGAALLALALPAAVPPLSGGAPGAPSVMVTDNAFVRAAVQRPTVSIARGGSVTWRWASQQSHGISVRSGPDRSLRAANRTSGRVTWTFRKAGTYRLECPLHAPGMRMKVVVRR